MNVLRINRKQRIAVSIVLERLIIQYVDDIKEIDRPELFQRAKAEGINLKAFVDRGRLAVGDRRLRLTVQGGAGRGKTHANKIRTRLTLRLFNDANSALNLAPTGAASVLMYNGRTIHSIAAPPRNLTDEFSAADFTTPAAMLDLLRQRFGDRYYQKLKLLNLDERSMTAKELVACLCVGFSPSSGTVTSASSVHFAKRTSTSPLRTTRDRSAASGTSFINQSPTSSF